MSLMFVPSTLTCSEQAMTTLPTPAFTPQRIGAAVLPSSCMTIRAAGMPSGIAKLSFARRSAHQRRLSDAAVNFDVHLRRSEELVARLAKKAHPADS